MPESSRSLLVVSEYIPGAITLKQLLERLGRGVPSEGTIWNCLIQLSSALRFVHHRKLAMTGCLHASKVLVLGPAQSRVLISGCGVMDIVHASQSASAPDIKQLQQADITMLGQLVLTLLFGLVNFERVDITPYFRRCLEDKSINADLRSIVQYLLVDKTANVNGVNTQLEKTMDDIMPRIGSRFYTELDAACLHNDILENELSKEMENGRVFRLLSKLCLIVGRPILNNDTMWHQSNGRFMLELFRNYLFYQYDDNGRPWMELSHVIQCLNKLDAGSSETLALKNVSANCLLVVTYDELKRCLDASFDELQLAAAGDLPHNPAARLWTDPPHLQALDAPLGHPPRPSLRPPLRPPLPHAMRPPLPTSRYASHPPPTLVS